jgi:hypothetical protein
LRRWKLGPAYLATASTDQLVQLGRLTSLEHRRHVVDPTLLGLHEMITYGLRGLAAYTHHAEVLGYTDRQVGPMHAKGLRAQPAASTAPLSAALCDRCLVVVLTSGTHTRSRAHCATRHPPPTCSPTHPATLPT